MIKNKKQLNKILKEEKKFYYTSYCMNKRDIINRVITRDPLIIIYKYIKYLRKSEYYYNCNNKLLYAFFRYKKNKLGIKLGLEIWENNFDSNLMIYHAGNIVVNRGAKIGKNCKLHGDNCIGNNGVTNKVPIIGDNVDIGVGAKIIGDVKIANNIVIGAGAVVTKSFLEEGTVICGVPAKKIR